MPAIHVEVVGQVQGVGFRWFVREVARRRELSGWVRNCPDGSVEIAAAGSEEAIEYMRLALQRGPEGATIDDVVEHPDVAGKLPFPFAILR